MGSKRAAAVAAKAALLAGALKPLGADASSIREFSEYLVACTGTQPRRSTIRARAADIFKGIDPDLVVDAVEQSGAFGPRRQSAASEPRDAVPRRFMAMIEDRWVSDPGSRVNDFPATRRQRAFELFGDEKASGARLGVAPCGGAFQLVELPSLGDSGVYRTASGRGCVVLIENLDPYLSLASALGESECDSVLGVGVSALVYLGGMAKAGVGMVDGLLKLHGLDRGDVRYWGDIDRAGLAALYRYQTTNRVPIRPFSDLYGLCLDKQRVYAAHGVYPTPASVEQKLDCREADVLDDFDPDIGIPVAEIIVQNLRIPQEVLAMGDYARAVSCGAHAGSM